MNQAKSMPESESEKQVKPVEEQPSVDAQTNEQDDDVLTDDQLDNVSGGLRTFTAASTKRLNK